MTWLSRTCSIAAATLLLVSPSTADPQPRPRTTAAPPLRTDAIARVARLRTSSVVAVHTVTRMPAPGLPDAAPDEEGLGSGVVIDATGLILTNAHVIEGASVVHIRTPEGDDISATVLGATPDVDLALLRASDARGLRPAPLGDSDRLEVGQWVVAIGNPLGLHHTVTTGIISAKSRTLDDSGVEFLQTDAAISPGSSGGPLLDLVGRVIGINVGMLSTGRQNVGLNLAIPVNVVKDVLPRLRSGTVNGWIGVTTVPLTARGATTRGVADGLVITAVTEGSAADRAGLRAGDIVTGVAGGSEEVRDLYSHVRRTAPGSVVNLGIWRN